MRTSMVVALAFAAVSLASCGDPTTSTVPSINAAPTSAPNVRPPARWDFKQDGKAWTEVAHRAVDTVGGGLLSAVPSDIAAYCPRYASADPAARRAFWVYLLSALARYESNYDPKVTFTESFPAFEGGPPVVSRGLLQLSYDSALGYGCPLSTPEDLHDPRTNIECGVRVMNRLVTRDGLVAGQSSGKWRGASAYWSPFRDATKRAAMAAATAEQPYCR
jgi:hypothetical protein